MGEDNWIPFDEVRPTEEGIQVWAWCVPYGPMPSTLDQWEDLDIEFPQHARVCETYRTPKGEVRINCAASQRVLYWQPYHIPGPPSQSYKEVQHGANPHDQA